MTGAILAIDQGTSATKALLVDAAGAIVARGSAPVALQTPRPGWVQQDADELWASVLDAVARCLAAPGAAGAVPAAVAVTNQRESALVWDRATGAPAGPVIGWQDTRGAGVCARLVAAGHEPLVRERSGLPIDPMFSATKLAWLLAQLPGGGADGAYCAGTVDAWLVHRLTGGAAEVIELGNASRTALLGLHTLEWDADLLELFGVPAAALPQPVASDADFGVTAAAGALPAGLPVHAVMADSHAALFGHGAHAPGTGKATFGTGSSVMTPVSGLGEPPAGLVQTVAWSVAGDPVLALEGNVVATGAGIEWMAATLGVPGGDALEALATTVPDAEGVAFVPAFAGLGAPYWDRDATGVVTGISRGTRPAHLARAALESVAHQVCDVLEAVDAHAEVPLRTLYADGGITASSLVMGLVADLGGREVQVAGSAEMSGLGVAHLAGARAGLWSADAALPRPTRRFAPHAPDAERRGRRAAWADAVARSRGRATGEGATEKEQVTA
jgi:glycerol kinase